MSDSAFLSEFKAKIMVAVRSGFVILTAFAPCVQQEANANTQHEIIMPRSKDTVGQTPFYVNLCERSLEKFWSRVNRDGECWIWTAGKGRRGYGKLKVANRTLSAHRVSWSLANGAIPTGMLVRHSCDCVACVNPSHLLIGTPQDNMDDMVKRGRSLKGLLHHLAHHSSRARGEAVNTAKLTAEQAMAIRRRYADDRTPQRVLAEEFGVTQAVVSKCIRRDTWKHL